MKAGVYLRVSTEAQSEKYSIPAQKELLEKYCDIREYELVKYYTDAGFSGSNINRPALNELCNDCSKKLFDVIVVYKLDRLSRSQKDTLYLIEEVFIPNGIDFVSVSENFDTSTPFGKAMIGILSVFAQLERETIRERTRMGMKERLKKGYWSGGGKTPYGYDYCSEKGILIKNENAPAVKKMFELYLSGWSAEKIASYFGLKYDRLVMQILSSKANCGLITYKGEEYQGKHDGIVSKDVFLRTQELIEKRRRANLKGNKNLLTGLVCCGVCGAKMRYQKWGKNGHKICCYSQQSTKEYLIKKIDCDNKKNWAYEIEDCVVGEIKKFSLDPARLYRESEEKRTKEKNAAVEAIAELNKKIDRLISFLSEGIAGEDVKTKLIQLCKKRDNLLKLNNQKNIAERGLSLARSQVENISSVWDILPKEKQRAIVVSLIKKVVVTYERIDVYYNF